MPDRSKVYPAQIPPLPLRPSRSGLSKKSRKRLAYAMVAAIAAIVVSALLLAAFPPGKEVLLRVGSTAPPFTLRTPSGAEVALHGPALIEFCATWAPECAVQVPALNGLAAGGRVISVNGDSENAESVRAFVRFNHVRFPIVLDPGSRTVAFPARGPRGPVTASYRVTHFPTYYVVDVRGRVAWRFAGAASQKRLRAELSQATRPVP